MIFYASLFFFFGSFFLFMYPTVKRQLCAMQRAGYRYEKFVPFMKTQRKVASMWLLAAFIVSSYLLQKFLALPIYLFLHGLPMLILGLIQLKQPKEPTPKLDGRMLRLCTAAGGLFLALFLLLGILFRRSFFWEMPFVIMFLGFMTDTWILLASFLIQPGQKRRAKAGGRAAVRRLTAVSGERYAQGKPEIIKIGVAGSYGKSGLIAAARHLLGGRFRVLATEGDEAGSLSAAGKLISEGLTEDTDVLLLEISARQPGDVRSFCESISIDRGVVTSISERSMETFLSIERVAETQMELLAALPESEEAGPCFNVNYDDEQVRKQKTQKRPILRYGLYRGESNPQHLDVYAREIHYYWDHTDFTLMDRSGGGIGCSIPQPGKFALLAAVGAAGLARSLGLTMEEIKTRLSTLPRLNGYLVALTDGAWPEALRKKLAKPWETDGAETRERADWDFLDDASAFSLESAKDSLAILGVHPGYRLVITAGLTDQGQREDEVNRQLGRQAARFADDVIVIGKGKFSVIEDGAQRAGFHMENMHLAADAREAFSRAKALAQTQRQAGEKVCMLLLGRFG